MADTSPETKSDEKAAHVPAPIETGAWQPGADSHATAGDATPRAVPSGFPENVKIAEASVKSLGERDFNAHTTAEEINTALHVPFFSTRFFPDGDKVFDKMLNMTPDEFKATEADFNKNFAPGDKPYFSGDQAWTLKDDIQHQLSSSQSDRLDKLMESKAHNDVPPVHRVDGEQLLKPGSPLKVGEINAVTLPDGRRYDVYVPKNADNRGPTVVAMHGAAGGDSAGLMAQESGLTADAERTGQTVVFAYPKPRSFDVGVANVTGVAWNVPGRENLPKAASATDDRNYLDNVLSDLSKKATTSEKVGLFGFSDGGRFAEAYAADRPDKVAAVVSEDGTWMKNDKLPTSGKPIMIVHGDADETLPYNGGMGSVSRKMDWLLGTNLKDSAPYMQAEVWKSADRCDGPIKVHERGDVTERDYSGCKVGEVKEYIVKGGHHGINDYKNDGVRAVQWMLGSADRRQDFSTQGAEFLKKWIVSDPSMERPR